MCIRDRSNGSGMTQQFSRRYGYLLAGAACSAGSCRLRPYLDKDTRALLNQGGPLAVWESHPENNGYGNADREAEARTVRESRYYWMRVNGCGPMPKIRIEGEANMAFYMDGKAPYVFNDIKLRDHGQALDEAFFYWDYLFAGTRRAEDGTCLLYTSHRNQNIVLWSDLHRHWVGIGLAVCAKPDGFFAVQCDGLPRHGQALDAADRHTGRRLSLIHI